MDNATLTEPRLSALVSDIAKDAQKLMEQQWAMAKTEVSAEYDKAKQAATVFVIGAVFAGVTIMLLAFAVAHWLTWAAPSIHLGASYTIVGLITAAIGAGLFIHGKQKADNISLTPERTLNTVKSTVKETIP